MKRIQSSRPVRLFIRRRPRSLATWIGASALAGGVVIAGAALIAPVDSRVRVAPLEGQVAIGEPMLITAAEPRPVPDPMPIVEIEAEVIEAARPSLAIAHEEPETDFDAISAEQMKAGDIEAAFESMRKQLYSSTPTAELLLRMGRVGREIGQLALAEQALLDAGNLEPDNADIHTELSRLYMDAKDFENARFSARQAIRLDPESAPAWNLAGRAAMGESEFQRAELAYRRAVALDPSDPMLHNNLGLLYIFMRAGKDAVDSLETSVELYGDGVPHYVLNNLGLAYELNDQLEDARDSFEQALLVDPMYARAHVNMQRIDRAMLEREDRRVVAELPPSPADDVSEETAVETSDTDSDEIDTSFDEITETFEDEEID